MPQFIPALFAVVLTISPIYGQFGGTRFPGMGGRNPNGYPGQQAPSQPKVYGPTETLTGTLREISSSDLIIDSGDDQIILVQIQNGTKYLSTMGKVKVSDFEAGDHVTVEATLDADNHYYSKTVTMNKKGTPEEKAAAMQAANSSHSGSGGGSGSPSDSDSDPDRPRLHRANPDSSASGGSSASSDSNQSSAPSSANAGARSTASSDSGNSNSSGSQSSPARNYPQSASDDSGPPVLRRSSSGSQSDTQTATSPQQASTQSGGARPSLSAEDVNGVTRLPVIPPPPSSGSDDGGKIQERSGTFNRDSDGGDPIIDQAREAAFSFSETLPNYVVKQLTNRYSSGSANRGRTTWQPLDIVTTDLVYEDGKERYTNVMINGKPTKYIEQTGSWSEGEFASMLQAILAPGTNADFRNQHAVTIANRPAWRYDYTVEKPRSTWTLHADGQTITPSYTGSIWIDKATYRVLRIEISARNLPREFPLDTAESSIDYDFVTIGDQKVLLPADAESLSCTRGTSDCTKNHTEFHNYRKFGADSSISFEGADK